MAKHHNSGEPERLGELGEKLLEYIKGRKGCAVDDVLSYAVDRLGMKTHEAAKLLYLMKERGMVVIIDPKHPQALINYFFSSHVVWFWALFFTVILMLLSVYLLPSNPPAIYIRYIIGSVFVLYLPGASLVELLYPSGHSLSQLERVALSIGLSLALVPLIGLVLNYTPWGIRLDPVLASLSIVTLCLASGAVVRKYSLSRLASLQTGGGA